MYYIFKNFPQIPIDDIIELTKDKYFLGNQIKRNGLHVISCIPQVTADSPNEGMIEDGGLVDYQKITTLFDMFPHWKCNLYSTEDPVSWERIIRDWKEYMVKNNYNDWEIVEGGYDENRVPR